MIQVLIAEDMHMIRGALALLSLEPDMEVVAELERGDEIVPTALETRPDVAVVDIDLPDMDGLTAAEQLGDGSRVPRLVLTGLSRPGLLRASRSTCAASCSGLLTPPPPWPRASATSPPASGSSTPTWSPPPWRPAAAPHRPRGRRPPHRRDRHHHRADRRAPLALPRHRAQLSLQRHRQGRRPQPAIDAIRIARSAGWL